MHFRSDQEVTLTFLFQAFMKTEETGREWQVTQAVFLLVQFIFPHTHTHTLFCLEHLSSEGIKPVYEVSETGENIRMVQLELIRCAEMK